MFYQKNKKSIRRNHGSALADAPGTIWALFIMLAFPAMCYASLFYRATFVYFATRDASYYAAKSATFTLAQTNANTRFTTDMNTFNGISGTYTLYIVAQPIAGGTPTYYTAPLAPGTLDTTNNVYFLKVVTASTIQPLFNMGPSWLGMSIPGLTGPYNLTVVSQFFSENPTGLMN
ncbi:MAG: hypothetical protein C5B53_13495 [Candidatus Melainabacteria bacterium]|nr:MAG: hypothetical protein C5B53_13495 [Candidatus Melainabacteria bacterium]